jgi:hypothetical protein
MKYKFDYKFAAIAILLLSIMLCIESEAQNAGSNLTIEVIERGTKDVPAAWVRIQTVTDDNIHGWYNRGLKGLPIQGSTTLNVPAGRVIVTAWNSNCEEVRKEITITDGKPAKCTLTLVRRFDMHNMGYFSFEGHDHMDGESKMNLPPFIYPYCAAMGIDHLSVCQLWFHTQENPVSYDSIMTYLKAHSTPRLGLSFGAESPKLRYGHTWTVNHPGLPDPLGDYLNWHDVVYFKSQVATDSTRATVSDLRGTLHAKWQPPFVDRLRNNARGAFSVASHPTRWWHHRSNEVFPGTNLSADLAFDLLVAQSYDGLAVIGDSKDNIPYQNLWFNILNLGYRLTPVTESDGDVANGSLASKALTYVWTGQSSFDMTSLVNGLKAGHTTLSGKATMILNVNGKPPGSTFTADGIKHTLNVEVFSEPDSDEFVSYIVMYRNGKVVEKRDFRKQKMKSIKTQFQISENETAWYVVKSYGRVYPKKEIQFDVMAYADQILQDPNSDYVNNSGVSLTAPIYFNATGWTEPAKIISEIHGEVADKTGLPLKGLRVEIWNIDEKLAELVTDDYGRFSLHAPATIDVRFTLPGGQKEQQWLFYEYPPLLDLIEDTYTIGWAKEYPQVQGGNIPWKAFHYDEIRNVLKQVNWKIQPIGKIMLPASER